ncbi:DJ-1/PfpI family protein, partial [Halorubrum tibetense]
MNVDVLLYDGFDELDGIGPYEVFDYAFQYADGDGGTPTDATDTPTDAETIRSDRAGRVRYVALDEAKSVTASHGTRVGVSARLPDPTDESAPDLLVVPGGGWTDRDETAS